MLQNFSRKYPKPRRGFTLIELLVVISIIGVLSSVVLAGLNSARAKARDARRLSDIAQIQKALELYYNDKGKYPGVGAYEYYYAQTGPEADGCGTLINWGNPNPNRGAWCLLEDQLRPYISSLPRDPRGNQNIYRYTYKYVYPYVRNISGYTAGDTYGLSAVLENSSNISQNDGGYAANHYEVGGTPAYCKNKYTGTNGNWNVWNYINTCIGGN